MPHEILIGPSVKTDQEKVIDDPHFHTYMYIFINNVPGHSQVEGVGGWGAVETCFFTLGANNALVL